MNSNGVVSYKEFAQRPLNLENNSVTSLIIRLLSSKFPLKAMDIFSMLSKSYNKSVSYQAVAKSLRTLHKQDIIEKDRRLYFLNPQWVLSMHSFFSVANNKYAEFTEEDLVARFLFEEL